MEIVKDAIWDSIVFKPFNNIYLEECINIIENKMFNRNKKSNYGLPKGLDLLKVDDYHNSLLSFPKDTVKFQRDLRDELQIIELNIDAKESLN